MPSPMSTAKLSRNRAPLRPLQPYLPASASGYRELPVRSLGVGLFYAFDSGAAGMRSCAVPDACVDLLFGVDPAGRTELVVGGTVLAASGWTFAPGCTWVGCRFEPASCVLPQGVAMGDLVGTDLHLPGDAFGAELEERLLAASNSVARADVLACYLAARATAPALCGAEARLERYVRERICATDGAITVAMLARETGVSERYLRRVFRAAHGISPKQFACFVRFQRLLALIERAAPGTPVKELALTCGYYDQAHLDHEFKRFAGMTPERYRALRQPAPLR